MTVYNIETYVPNGTTESPVMLRIEHHPFRKGDSVDAYYGPTPDEPEECILEEVWLLGKHHPDILLPTEHRFYEMFDEERLFSLVEAEVERYMPDYA